jgi:hypothetical protein
MTPSPWAAATNVTTAAPEKHVFIDAYESATSVVYLCDASGSMLTVFGNLKQQLKEPHRDTGLRPVPVTCEFAGVV